MKQVFAFVVFLAVSAWSNIFSIDAGISFEKGYLDIDTTKTCNVDTSYINCSLEKGLAYYSTLDTAVAVFFMPRIAKASVYALQSNPNTHSLTEILRYEFIKWVEWGIIVMTKDSAQRLLDRILPDSLQMNNRHILHKKVCDTDPSQCPEAARLPQKKVLAESSEPAQADTSASEGDSSGTVADTSEKPLRIFEPANFVTPSVVPGMRYHVFDVNGVFIRSGIWQGSLKATGSTRVVRFENGKTVILR